MAAKCRQTALQLRVLSENGTQLAQTALEAPELDQLIRAMSNFRAQLAEPVTPMLDDKSRIADCIPDPKIVISRNKGAEDRTLIALRHPGFGWLGFLIGPKSVRALVERLTAAQ